MDVHSSDYFELLLIYKKKKPVTFEKHTSHFNKSSAFFQEGNCVKIFSYQKKSELMYLFVTTTVQTIKNRSF